MQYAESIPRQILVNLDISFFFRYYYCIFQKLLANEKNDSFKYYCMVNMESVCQEYIT